LWSSTNLTQTFENNKTHVIKPTNLYAVKPVQNGTWIKWKSLIGSFILSVEYGMNTNVNLLIIKRNLFKLEIEGRSD
jgi:hypothetical protein